MGIHKRHQNGAVRGREVRLGNTVRLLAHLPPASLPAYEKRLDDHLVCTGKAELRTSVADSVTASRGGKAADACLGRVAIKAATAGVRHLDGMARLASKELGPIAWP